MSFAPGWRTNCTANWGGRCDFRGLQQTDVVGNTGRNAINRGQVGTVIFRGDLGRSNSSITGVTRDNTGAALANCVVILNQGNVIKAQVTSDGSGSFTFSGVGSGPFFITAYKPGSPDVAGISVNTLQSLVV